MTTNNHPAHGPVSLDRLRQIREILSKASGQSDGGNLGCAMADAVKVIDGAISAFGVEPAPLQLPVQHWEELCRQHPDMSIGDAIIRASWWNHCAAMLQAEPVSNRDELLPSIKHAPELDSVAKNAKSPPSNPPSKCSLRDGIEAIRNSGIPVDVDKIQSECEAGNYPVTPDGWVMVPVEPTPGMMVAGTLVSEFQADPAGMYRAMIAAAPQKDVKSALEHGMQRYAGAMQKLADAGD